MASNLSAFPFIEERSHSTPGLFNRLFSIFSSNLAAVDSSVSGFSGDVLIASSGTFSLTSNLSVGRDLWVKGTVTIGVEPSVATRTALNIGVRSDTSDYIYFTDESAIRSNYIIGSHVGGTQDGLNIWDASGNTMIASFSKQSIRFFQQVVGPVFDLGGALTGTYNAATFGSASDSKESRIQAAISAATTDNVPRVYIPSSMLSYRARLVSFSTRVQMVREGGDQNVCDVIAYGADPSLTTSSTSAIQSAMISAQSQGRVCYIPAGGYLVEGLTFYSSLMVRGGGSGSGINPVSYLYQNSAATSLLRPFDPTARTQNFVIEDILLSSFGNTANMGLVDCVNCIQFVIERVSFSGASQFFIRCTGGATAGDAGFGLIDACEFQSPQAGVTSILLQSTTNDQPDGMVVSNCYLHAASQITWIGSVATVGIGAGTFSLTNARCESSTSFISIMSGRFSNAKIIGNRFETTASNATMGVTLRPASAGNSQICAVFLGNTYAAPSGTSWIDDGFHRAIRWGDDETGALIFNSVHDGTAINPAYSFRSDNSLGFWKSGKSAIAVAGSESFAMPVGTTYGRLFKTNEATWGIGINMTPAFGSDTASIAGFKMMFNTLGGASNGMVVTYKGPSAGNADILSLESTGALGLGFGIATYPGMGFLSERSLGWYRSGSSTMALSYGTFNLASQAVRLSMRTLAASSITATAANTNVATNEVVFTIGGASGASLCISSGGTTYIFGSVASAKNT